MTDQNNKATTYTYDDADRLTAVTDPANHTTQYAYDTEDNLLSITDANGHITSFGGWPIFPVPSRRYYGKAAPPIALFDGWEART